MVRERRWLLAGLATVALLIVAGRAAGQMYVDYRWYMSLGAGSLWWLKAQNILLLKGASLVLGGAFVFGNLYAVRQSVASVVLPRRVGDLEIGEEVSGRFLLLSVAATSLVLASALTLPSDAWPTLAAARFGAPFGESDPRFQSDLRFWVYWLPLEQALYAQTLVIVAVAIAAVVCVYALTPSLRWDRGTLRVSTYARRHLSVLSAVVLLILGWSYRLDAFEALLDGSGPRGTPSWVDHQVHVPASIAMAVVSVVASAIVGLTAWARQTRLAFIAATAVLGLSLVLRQAAPIVALRMSSGTDASAREANYVATRAAYTRRAFAADRVTPADSALAFPSPAAAAASVPLWDPPVFTRAVERTRRLGVVSGGVGTAGAIGAPTLTVAERPAALVTPAGSLRPWNAVSASGSAVSERGELAPPDGIGIDDAQVGTVLPALVFDSARGYVLLPDTATQLGAVDVDGGGARLALALSEQNLRLLRDPAPGRALLHRDARERVAMLAPFFAQSEVLSPAVAGDTLYWILHLYSTSGTYPVSRPARVGTNTVRYLRRAAVAVVHAFSGRVWLIPDAEPDPIALSWLNALPRLFTSWAGVPDAVRRAVPPAAEAAAVQSAAFAEYGPRGGEEPLPRFVRVPARDTATESARFPVVLLPPNGGTPAVSMPVADGAGRLAGLVIATGGTDPRTAWYPITPTAADPSLETVLDRLHRGAEPPRAAGDERHVPGAERVIPVGGGAGFVVPHYAERGDAAPAIATVATYFGGEFRTGASAIAALGPPAPGAAVPTPGQGPPTGADSLGRARALYDAARAALRAGDWAAFGRAYDALGAALGRRSP